MYLNDIIAPNNVKELLYKIYNLNRIPHALLFLGSEGSGNLSIALSFAKKIIDKKNINLEKINFIYPIYKITKKQKIDESEFFLSKWYDFIKSQPYGSLKNWKKFLNIKNNKNFQIGIDQINYLLKISYYKNTNNRVIIIWMPELLNINASNKLINILDNAPEKIYFFFVGENDKTIPKTLISRIQVIKFNKINDVYIEKSLIEKFHINNSIAKEIAIKSNGNWNKALKILLKKEYYEIDFHKYLILWMRYSFLSKKNIKYIKKIIILIENINFWSKDNQIEFLIYCVNIFRKILLNKYNIIIFTNEYKKFNFQKFVNIVNINNIEKILKIIDTAIYHIEKNANVKILFIDLTNKIQKYIFI